MPSSVSISGSRIYRPGVYGQIDASSLGGSGTSTGNVAVVGPFPTLEQNKPAVFSSARAVRDFDPDDFELQQIAKLAFAPSTDARVGGGADNLTLISTQGSTQATYPGGKDAGGAAALSLASKLWGTKGNRTHCSIAVNASVATALDIVLSRGGSSETYEALESGPVAELWFDGSELTASAVSVDHATLLWQWEKEHTFTAPGGAQSVTTSALTQLKVKSGSTVAVTSSNAGAGAWQAGKTLTVTVTGLSAAGAAQTGTATITYAQWNADNAVSKTVQVSGSDATWSTITEVTYAMDDAAFTGRAKLTGTAFNIDLATDFSYVGDIVQYINAAASTGWNAVAVHPRAGKIPATEMDKQALVNVYNAAGASASKCVVRSDLWSIIQALSTSKLVTATRAAGANKRPGPASLSGYSESFHFSGGSVSANADADYDASLQVLETRDIQIVVPMGETLVVHKKIIAHCVASALAGYERCGYVGVPKSQSLATVFDSYSSKLNSRHVAVFAQEVQVEDALGNLQYRDPVYGAILLAGMQAGTSVATPLTTKRPSVFATRQSWDPNRDAGEAISKGIINLSSDTLGIKVERSVTTHLEDDNPIFSEVSANESINTSVRDLRNAVKGQIGDAVFAGTAGQLLTIATTRLKQQVRAGIIKAWQNAAVTDLGDRIDIAYECAPVEPLNFIVLNASAVRIASEV